MTTSPGRRAGADKTEETAGNDLGIMSPGGWLARSTAISLSCPNELAGSYYYSWSTVNPTINKSRSLMLGLETLPTLEHPPLSNYASVLKPKDLRIRSNIYRLLPRSSLNATSSRLSIKISFRRRIKQRPLSRIVTPSPIIMRSLRWLDLAFRPLLETMHVRAVHRSRTWNPSPQTFPKCWLAGDTEGKKENWSTTSRIAGVIPPVWGGLFQAFGGTPYFHSASCPTAYQCDDVACMCSSSPVIFTNDNLGCRPSACTECCAGSASKLSRLQAVSLAQISVSRSREFGLKPQLWVAE